MPRRFYINSKMFRPPKSPPLPIAKSNLPEVVAEDTIYFEGNDQRSKILYVPRQVFMSDSFDTAGNNNCSITSASLMDQPALITKKKLNDAAVVIKKREIHEFQESGDDKIWSPLMDGIVDATEVHEFQESGDDKIWSPLMDGIVDAPGNCRKSGKDSEKVIDQKTVKSLDALIDRVLYGPPKRRMPAFEENCPE